MSRLRNVRDWIAIPMRRKSIVSNFAPYVSQLAIVDSKADQIDICIYLYENVS